MLFCKALNPNGVLKCVDTCCVKKNMLDTKGMHGMFFGAAAKNENLGLSLSELSNRFLIY